MRRTSVREVLGREQPLKARARRPERQPERQPAVAKARDGQATFAERASPGEVAAALRGFWEGDPLRVRVWPELWVGILLRFRAPTGIQLRGPDDLYRWWARTLAEMAR